MFFRSKCTFFISSSQCLYLKLSFLPLKDFWYSKDLRSSSQIVLLKYLHLRSHMFLLKDLRSRSHILPLKDLRCSFYSNLRIWDQERTFHHWRTCDIHVTFFQLKDLRCSSQIFLLKCHFFQLKDLRCPSQIFLVKGLRLSSHFSYSKNWF